MSLRKFCEITVATAKNQSLQDKPLSEIPPKQHNSVIGLTKLLFSSGSVENAMKIVKLSFSDYTRKALFRMDKYTKHWNEKVGDFINSRSQNIKQDKQKVFTYLVFSMHIMPRKWYYQASKECISKVILENLTASGDECSPWSINIVENYHNLFFKTIFLENRGGMRPK